MSRAAHGGWLTRTVLACLAAACASTPASAATVTLVPGAGFSDATPATPEGGNSGTTLGQQRTILFNAAAAAWGAALTSNQEIKIAAAFSALTCDASSGVLGSAGATNFLALDDGNGNRWYPIALAESLLGTNQNGTSAEISANFNATIDANDPSCLGSTRWYYGLVGPAPAGTFALYPTVMHEIGHGLGFAAFLCRTATGCTNTTPTTPHGGYFLGITDIWSDFLRDNNIDGASTNKLWANMTNAERVTSFTHDPFLVWDGANVTARLAAFGQDAGELNEARMRMYAPSPFQSGSSISHFHEDANPNLMMEPIADADVFRQTDLTDCLFEDIGWVNPRCDDTAPNLNAIANPAAINEDAGTQVVALSGINDGSGNTQSLSIASVSGNLALIPNPTVTYTSPGTTGSVSYAPLLNQSGTALVLVTVTDSAGSSLPRSFTVTVNPVNDAPTGSNLSAGESYTEDTPFNLIDIVTGDVDHANVNVTLTLSNPAAGALNTATSGAVTSTFNAGSGVWNASGATANVNVLLAGLTFTPAANFNANLTLATSVSDGVAAAVTGTKAMTGVAVNDPPSASNLSAAQTYIEDTTLNLTDIVVSDIDSANVTATLTLSAPAAGSLSTATAGAVTSTYNAGTGVWTASGLLASVNTLLAGVSYVPTANFSGNFNIATSVSDGVAAAVTGSKAMTGTPGNDAPVASNLSAAESYNEDTTLNLVDIVITDPDSLVNATLTLSNAGAGALSTATAGATTSSYDAGTGVWTATGTVSDVNTLLAGLSFVPTTQSSTSFSIATNVTDGMAAAVTGTKAVTGVAVNDAPTATNLSVAQTYTEDTALGLTDIVASDIDSANVTATLTLSSPAAGSLTTATSGAVTSTFNAGTGVWTASGLLADVNVLLAGVNYVPASNFNAAFNIASSISDGIAAAVTGSKAMTGTPVNDAPDASNLSTAESYTEETARNLVDIVVTDVDSASVTATLTLSNPAAGSLSTATSGAVTSTYAAGGGTWSASGALANVNTLLAGVTFVPSANFNADFSIATSVSDGTAAALTGSKAVAGTAVNDAPTASNLSTAEVFVENTPLNLVDIVVADIDNATVTATLVLSNVAAGSLSTATAGATTSSYNAIAGTWTATGALAEVNVLLQGVVFNPAPNFSAAFSIATSVSDGIAAAVTGSKAMTSALSNVAPQATNLSAPESYTEDVATALVDIVVTDPDSAAVEARLTLSDLAAGSLTTATVGSTGSSWTPGTGQWRANGPVGEVNALLATVAFQPAANFNSALSIATRIEDGINPALTGSKGVTALAVNDAPALDAIATPPAVLEDAGLQGLGLTGIGAGPGENQTLSIAAVSGNLSVIADPTVTYTSPAATGSLSYAPQANASGSATITVSVLDNGGVANGGVDSLLRQFTVTVLPVNDAPTLDAIADPAALPTGAAPQQVLLTGIGTGGGEAGQALTVLAVSANQSLIPHPIVTYQSPSATAQLAFQPVPGASGSATITVTVSDDGGTANGGVATRTRTFTITVDALPGVLLRDGFEG